MIILTQNYMTVISRNLFYFFSNLLFIIENNFFMELVSLIKLLLKK